MEKIQLQLNSCHNVSCNDKHPQQECYMHQEYQLVENYFLLQSLSEKNDGALHLLYADATRDFEARRLECRWFRGIVALSVKIQNE